MRIRWILFGAFFVIPIAEIALLLTFSRAFGIWWTIALVISTAFLGSWLVSQQARGTLIQVREEFARGVLPAAPLAHGAMIVIAGAFLVTPGLLTDATGLLLLIPAVREGLRKWWINRSANRWTIVS